MKYTNLIIYYQALIKIQNGDPKQPNCPGIKGVLSAYHSCIRSVRLYGPTCFAPVINSVGKLVSFICENTPILITCKSI